MRKVELPFDKPVEVDSRQFNRLCRQFKGMFAWRKSKGKYLVKQWFPKFRKQIEDCIN